jgi:diguanylate cyclase (GGDEF)-like protein
LDQQESQLRALRRVGRRLHSSEGIDHTLQRVVNDLQEVFNVEAIGLVLRTRDTQHRNRQILWLDGHQTPLDLGRKLRDVINEHLMPQVIANRSTTFFTDLQQYGAWGKAMWDSGLETLAATAICSRDQSQGILWIARRGGRPIDDYHLHLLEALAPLLATAIENASLRDQMRRNHLCDPVTDLPSARLLPEMIAQMVNRPGHPWSIIALDLDHFHPLNQKIGHAAADLALRRVAQILRDALRSGDHIVRYKNDRFVLVCPDIERHHAAALAERLCQTIAALDLVDNPQAPVRLTCSIGVAGSPSDHNEGNTLLIALNRLEAAKAAGRNRVQAVNAPGSSTPTV